MFSSGVEGKETLRMGIEMNGRYVWWTICLLSGASLAAAADLRLVEAAKQGDKEVVRSLLKQRADVNTRQADGTTALAWAAYRDDLETAELLIGAGANANAANDTGVTPLSLACTNGSAAMVERLLKAGADPKAAKWKGETVLMTCARTGNAGAVKALLVHGADANAKETRRGQTALMWAVGQEHPEAVRALVEHGADVNARSNGGFTPLLFAAQQGDLDSARILVAAGANVNDATPDGSALMVASVSGYEALAIFLVDKGADPNAADPSGITVLHSAVSRGLLALSGKAQREISANRGADFLPAPYWERPNALGLVKALLAHGANPNARIVKEPPPLPLCCRIPGSRISLVGATPFLLAAAAGDLSILRALAAGGADPLLATEKNVTPLMVAAGLGRFQDRKEGIEERSALEAVKLAVELGADINAVGENGWTALHAAAYTGADAIVQILADKGAHLDVKDKFGQTPLRIAEPNIGGPPGGRRPLGEPWVTHKSTAELLLKLGATPLNVPVARGSGAATGPAGQ